MRGRAVDLVVLGCDAPRLINVQVHERPENPV